MSTSLVDHPIFASCNRRQRRQISMLGTRVNVREGSVIAREGRPAREFGLIVSGVATVSARGVPLGTVGPGQHFGAVSLLERRDRFGLSAATVIAASDLVVEVLSIPEFDTLLFVSPQAREHLTAEVKRRRSILESASVDHLAQVVEEEHILVA